MPLLRRLRPTFGALATAPPAGTLTLNRRTRFALRAATVFAAVLAAILTATPAAAAPGAPPSSMASLGDSITRGFNACGWFVDCTSRSFATGDSTAVNSHYLRVRAVNGAIAGRNHNVAWSGSKAADMSVQAAAAVFHRVQYVTMLIGANDACTATEAGMTSTAAFRASVDAALRTLKAGLPRAQVLLVSIPDLRRLWDVGRVDSTARGVWSTLRICQSMLANPTSMAAADVARRERVRQRVADYNGQLAAACAAYGGNCRFDGNAIFGYPFTLAQLSTWDYFHPNGSGQTVLASVTYQHGFGW